MASGGGRSPSPILMGAWFSGGPLARSAVGRVSPITRSAEMGSPPILCRVECRLRTCASWLGVYSVIFRVAHVCCGCVHVVCVHVCILYLDCVGDLSVPVQFVWRFHVMA